MKKFGFVGGKKEDVIIVEEKIVGKIIKRRMIVEGNDEEIEEVEI